MLREISPYFEYTSLILAVLFYKRYKNYTFYKYFIIYLINIVLFGVIADFFIRNGSNTIQLYNVYTFFEFNFFTLIYVNLIKEKKIINFLKIIVFLFNVIYISSFYFKILQSYTVVLEGVCNSLFIILFFRELLNSERILNYKKLLSFWISVGFLLFYLTSIPFFTLLEFHLFNDRLLFFILYYLIIVFHLCFIYGLITCKKAED
jgi:hypothetical protein